MQRLLKLIYSGTWFLTVVLLLPGCDVGNRIMYKIELANKYEIVALNLAKENRLLTAQISDLNYRIKTLEAQNSYLQIKLEEKDTKEVKREIASVAPELYLENDLVKFDVYKWTPKQLLSIAENEFENKNYEKAAQFFYFYLEKHGNEAEKIDPHFDSILFQAGIAAYESGSHYDWTVNYLDHLIKKYPTSSHYRSAKLWQGLTHMKSGDEKRFYEILEEFRVKYRNTPEWKILSGSYEEFVQKIKK